MTQAFLVPTGPLRLLEAPLQEEVEASHLFISHYYSPMDFLYPPPTPIFSFPLWLVSLPPPLTISFLRAGLCIFFISEFPVFNTMSGTEEMLNKCLSTDNRIGGPCQKVKTPSNEVKERTIMVVIKTPVKHFETEYLTICVHGELLFSFLIWLKRKTHFLINVCGR